MKSRFRNSGDRPTTAVDRSACSDSLDGKLTGAIRFAPFLPHEPGAKTVQYYLARPSSSSITRTKFSSGWAPTSSRLLTKNAGVPVTPRRALSSMSFWTAA